MEFVKVVDNRARPPRYLISAMNTVPTAPFNKALAIKIACIDVLIWHVSLVPACAWFLSGDGTIGWCWCWCVNLNRRRWLFTHCFRAKWSDRHARIDDNEIKSRSSRRHSHGVRELLFW